MTRCRVRLGVARRSCGAPFCLVRLSRTRPGGFTLIEVSLAIVIGVIILAGGINLYNQTKVNAGNSKAQEKVQALAAIVEELMAVSNTGIYPSLSLVSDQWSSRREDYPTSPWGGSLTTGQWVTAFGSADNGAALSWGVAISAPYTATRIASQGCLMYLAAPDVSSTSCLDVVSGRSWNYSSFMVAIINQVGDGPCFVLGGRR